MSDAKFYTDYPIAGNEEGVVVAIELLAYDRNKYLTVRFGDSTEEVKTGYVYKVINGKTKKWLSTKDILSLPTSTDAKAPTQRDIHSELKSKRSKKTTYSVWVGGTRSEFNTLKEVFAFVFPFVTNTTKDIVVMKEFRSKHSWYNAAIVEVTGNDVWDFPERRRGARNSGVLSKKYFRELQKLAQYRKES